MWRNTFKLKRTPYRWHDFIAIPFHCDLIATIMLGIQKLLTALSAVIQVIIMANFLDCANTALKAGMG